MTAVTLSIDLIVAAIRYGSLRLEALSPALRARIEAFEAGKEGEEDDDENGEGDQGEG